MKNEKSTQAESGLKVLEDDKPVTMVSRRSVFAGVASLGALLATGLAAPSEAQAHGGPVKSWFRRWWNWWTGQGSGGSFGGKGKGGGNRGGGHGGGHGGRSGGGAQCFLTGTQIKTLAGDASIETLEIGDLVVTVSGELKPIKWIGLMSFDRAEGTVWDAKVAPIKISQGALDGALPTADLYVSGSHCLLIEGMLIPAAQLVNGYSIELCSSYDAQKLEYLHIELADHDVVLANGVPAETILASGDSRKSFDNWAEHVALYGESTAAMVAFAPMAYNGTIVEGVQSRLRRIVAPMYDVRRPLDAVRDAIDNRAYDKRAA